MRVARTIPELVKILETKKRIKSITAWRPLDTKCELGAGIEISGIIEEGISFRARCKADLPDESVSFMLFTETSEKPRPFARIDWRGSKHENNNRLLCQDFWGESAGRTHFHDLRMNAHIDYEVLFLGRFDLPVAQEIAPEPTTFGQLASISGKLLNITNTSDIPEPPWPDTASLF